MQGQITGSLDSGPNAFCPTGGTPACYRPSTDAGESMDVGEMRVWEIRDENWVGRDLSGQELGFFVADGSTFERCDFSGTSFEKFLVGHKRPTRFVDCTFRRTRFPLRNLHLRQVRFERCVFDGAQLRGMRTDTMTEFVDCTFRGRVWHVIFRGDLHREWRGNDFSEAELVDVDFRDIDLRAQRWPADESEYAVIDRIDERVAAALEAELPKEAVRTLTFLGDVAWRDPNGLLLLRKKELGHGAVAPMHRDELWRLLVERYRDDQE